MKPKFNVVFILLALFSFDLNAATVCHEEKDPDFEFCAITDVVEDDSPYLYFFHGAGGNARTGEKVLKILLPRWPEDRPFPVIVTISFAKLWFLSIKDSVISKATTQEMAKTIIPRIESKLGFGPRRRLLLGGSMGGFNAIQMALREPKVFEKIAIACPAVSVLSPYAGIGAVESYIKRTGADRKMAYTYFYGLRYFFPTKKLWKEADPIALAPQLLSVETPPLHISCGRTDEYGFFEGAETFAEIALKNAPNVTWQPLEGKHCDLDADAVISFLTNP